jgi:hypothetical protein
MSVIFGDGHFTATLTFALSLTLGKKLKHSTKIFIFRKYNY